MERRVHFNDDLPLLVPPCPSPQDLADLQLHQTYYFLFIYLFFFLQLWSRINFPWALFLPVSKKVRMCLLNSAIIIAIIAIFFAHIWIIFWASYFILVALDLTYTQTCILLLQIRNLKVHLTSKQCYWGRFQIETRPKISICTNCPNDSSHLKMAN